jgi:ACS family hexuronate transporter-like MFS transporter
VNFPPPFRWRVVALLFALSVLNYIDRQSLSVLAPTLESALGFSTVQYSYIVVSFLAAYSIGYLFCGSLVDRFGVRRTVAGAVAVWSLASLLHVWATGWIGLLGCRFILGLGESCNSPCGLKAMAEWIPRRERGLSTAIFSNGYIVGAMLAPPFVAWIALRFGWQWAFVGTSGLGLGYLGLWLRQYQAPEREPRLDAAERAYIFSERGGPPDAPAISLLGALRNPLCFGLAMARLFTDSLSYFITFWLPTYLHGARGFSLAMIGLWAWIPFLAADVGGPGGGALSDWLVRRGWAPAAARRRLMLAAACLMPVSLVAVHARSAAFALALIAVLLGAQSCWNSNFLTLISEVFPRRHVATYAAATGMAGAAGGVITTLLAGQLIHNVGYVPVFTGLGFLHLTAFVIVIVAFRRAENVSSLR